LQVVATIKSLPLEQGVSKRSIVYEACPNFIQESNRQCQKKLTELEPGSGVWSCARCGTVSAAGLWDAQHGGWSGVGCVGWCARVVQAPGWIPQAMLGCASEWRKRQWSPDDP